jgi:hypothetical protein
MPYGTTVIAAVPTMSSLPSTRHSRIGTAS